MPSFLLKSTEISMPGSPSNNASDAGLEKTRLISIVGVPASSPLVTPVTTTELVAEVLTEFALGPTTAVAIFESILAVADRW